MSEPSKDLKAFASTLRAGRSLREMCAITGVGATTWHAMVSYGHVPQAATAWKIAKALPLTNDQRLEFGRICGVDLHNAEPVSDNPPVADPRLWVMDFALAELESLRRIEALLSRLVELAEKGGSS